MNGRISEEIEALESMETKVLEDVDLSGSIHRLGEGGVALSASIHYPGIPPMHMDDHNTPVLLCGAPIFSHRRGIRISNTVIAASSPTSRSATL